MSIPESSPSDDVAIIGMACRLPGANSTSELWDMLAKKQDVRRKIDRFNVDGYYCPNGGKSKGLTNVQHAYIMDHDIAEFDNGFFAISPIEAQAMDPQHRLLLEVAYEAIENAGLPLQNIKGTDTAVYAGLSCNDYQSSILRDIDLMPKYAATGMHNSMAASRLSYFFDLHGPSCTIDTACSSTIVAMSQAISTLQTKESKMALVCGSHLILNPDMFVHMSELGFLSPSGRCRSFDANGDGYARGEGCLALLLKPLSQAVQDNDPIRAVIKGCRINHDGKTQGITLPSSVAQKNNMETLYRHTGVDPSHIQYVEAHGTGTAAGDPIECSALREIFGSSHLEEKLVIGSIKSNVGHLESCAALAGIIKTVECLERGYITGQLHYDTPNPKIPLDSLRVLTDVAKWPPSPDGIRRAGVNSFGFGGTNGHVILEQYNPMPIIEIPLSPRPYLFKVSAANAPSLQRLAAAYIGYCNQRPVSLADMSYTMLSRRTTLNETAFFTADSTEILVQELSKIATGEHVSLPSSELTSTNILFVFTGQGAQWAQMGKQLFESHPLFASIVAKCDRAIASLPGSPQWTIAEELMRPKESSNLSRADYSQPICTALQIGLFEVWRSWGVNPSAVVGHSSGEIGAAYAAGFLSLEEAMAISFYRGIFLNDKPSETKKGAMCAIGLGESAVQELLASYHGRVSLAAVNAPTSCTISGDEDAVQEICHQLKEAGIFVRMLRVDTAYHSHHMIPPAGQYVKALYAAGIKPSTSSPRCDLFSSVTGARLSPVDCSPEYWKDNMVSTVRFTAAVSAAVKAYSSFGAVLEVGPHPALKGPTTELMSTLSQGNISYFSSCDRGKPDFVALLESVAQMVNHELTVNLPVINSHEGYECRVLTDLPSYRWDHSIKHWAETRVSEDVRQRKFARHPLLGASLPGGNNFARTWRNIWRTQELDWLRDYKEDNIAIVPQSVFILMAMEATRQLVEEDLSLSGMCWHLQNITFPVDLLLAEYLDQEESFIESSFNLISISHCEFRFQIITTRSKSPAEWQKNCEGKLIFQPPGKEENDEACLMERDRSVKNSSYPLKGELCTHPAIDIGSATEALLDGKLYQCLRDAAASGWNTPLLDVLMGLSLKMPSQQPVPSRYRLHSIERVSVSFNTHKPDYGSFEIKTKRRNETEALSEMYIMDGSGVTLQFSGMGSRVESLVQDALPLQSLFLRPQLLPDITHLRGSGPLSFEIITLLVTHKWPMCDIAITGLDTDSLKHIINKLPPIHEHKRPRFRQVHIQGSGIKSSSRRIQLVDTFDAKLKYHLFIGTSEQVQKMTCSLHPKAAVCVRMETSDDLEWVESNFTSVFHIHGIAHGNWLFAQDKRTIGKKTTNERSMILTHGYYETFVPNPEVHLIPFELGAIVENLKLRETSDSLDITILDMGVESMLIDMKGKFLLPLLQLVIPRSRSLLWVSRQNELNPCANVAGSFLRTINCENPFVKVASLVFRDEMSEQTLLSAISAAQENLINGENEVEMVFQASQIHILRYHPDDELASSLGIRPPMLCEQGRSCAEYEILPTKPNHAIAWSYGQGHYEHEEHAKNVFIAVDASVIDYWDISRFSGSTQLNSSWNNFGHFFAGTVTSKSTSGLPLGSHVVGWYDGTHRATLNVPVSQICLLPPGISSSLAAAAFAAYSISFAALEGTARCQSSELVHINVSGIMAKAMSDVCHYLNITTTKHPVKGKRMFSVSHDVNRGILVDSNPVDIATYLQDHPVKAIAGVFTTGLFTMDTAIMEFPIARYQEALERTLSNPTLSVLIHDKICCNLPNVVVSYRTPKSIFRKDGAYVLLGGSGGLGRFLVQWMAQNGAQHLAIVSRSGMTKSDKRALDETVCPFDATVEVYKGDATDTGSLHEVLSKIRAKTKIIGCFNMVMVLNDSPFMKMTPEQWDNALQAKVQSTINLHNATKGDHLDFFIMFSSIASISGNMAQANYATGNSFQNNMAEYRRANGLTALSVALGVMKDVGVLKEEEDLLRNFTQKGMELLGPEEFCKIVEAAVYESKFSTRSMLSVGFQMFEKIDDKVQNREDQRQLFWTDSAEFGFLFNHRPSDVNNSQSDSLKERLEANSNPEQACAELMREFLKFLGNVLGYSVDVFQVTRQLATYGLDSLNAIACRFWFFKELSVDVSIFEIQSCASIQQLINDVFGKLEPTETENLSNGLPSPVAHSSMGELAYRPLSHSQNRIWFLHSLLADKTVYNLLLVCHISGPLDIHMFRKAWNTLVERHEVLRSAITTTEHGLQQIPQAGATFMLEEVEATAMTDSSVVENVTQLARNHIFDPEAGELIRGWLVKSPVGWKFFLASHHLAWDRSSVPTIFQETSAIYQNCIAGKPAQHNIPPVPYQFVDYTLWQNEYLAEGESFQSSMEYWRKELEGIPQAISLLPFASTPFRPTVKGYNTAFSQITLDPTMTSQIKEFCKSQAITPFMFMTATLGILMNRLTTDRDVIIGIADGDRGHTAFDSLVGFTVNMLPLRLRFDEDIDLLNFLKQFKETCTQAYRHRLVPFDYLLQHLDVPRSTGHSPIFQVMVNYQMQAAFPEYDYGTFKFTKYDHYNARSMADFYVDVEETELGALECTFNFDTSLYTKDSIHHLGHLFKSLISSIVSLTDRNIRLKEMNIMTPEDQDFVNQALRPEYSSYPSMEELDGDLFPDVLKRAVQKNPSKTAVVGPDTSLSYSELDARSNSIAQFLLDNDAKMGDRVAILCDPDCAFIVTIFGILKAGCVYVPLSLDFPKDRIMSMAKDAKFTRVFVNNLDKTAHDLLCFGEIEIYQISTALCMGSRAPPTLPRVVNADDKFCCIFTSGTTGRPKGIYIGHSNLRAQMEGYNRMLQTSSEDNLLLASSVTFDMSLPSIYGFVLYGATLHMATKEHMLSPSKMVDLLVDSQISSCVFTPTQVKLFMSASNASRLKSWHNLKSLNLGGEPVDPGLVLKLYGLELPSASLYNGYGPTEATVCNSIIRLDREAVQQGRICVGRPVFPSFFYILDENMNEVCPGMPGELYIGGPTVNKGYINRSDTTELAFKPNPWATQGKRGSETLYRTGDCFSLERDGTLRIHGRVDGNRQVKIRGMRTELDEIERAIWQVCDAEGFTTAHGISIVAVLYYKTGDILAAFLKSPSLSTLPSEQQEKVQSLILSRLLNSLPRHMIPSYLDFRKELPLSVSGKVDYRSMLSWPPPEAFQGGEVDLTGFTSLQAQIAAIWMYVLGSTVKNLCPDDDFFAVGGHSLLLIKVQRGFQEKFGLSVSLASLFSHSTIVSQEELISSRLVATKEAHGHEIDWEKETALLDTFPPNVTPCSLVTNASRDGVVLTGACTMAGTHMIHHLLQNTAVKIYCLAIAGETQGDAMGEVLKALRLWNMYSDVADQVSNRLVVYPGSLSDPTLGLSADQIDEIDAKTSDIYQLDSDVSLLKSYEHLLASNIGSLHFLLSLATRTVHQPKAVHYLSTWGVTHLQSWTSTRLSNPDWATEPIELTDMRPGTDSSLGYLSCRWACEMILYKAARRGLLVNIFRSSMCMPSPTSGVSLSQTDINRRILVASLHTGLVPNYSSDRGGGMSWVTADFLAESMFYLSQQKTQNGLLPPGKAQIHHLVPHQHTLYRDIPALLSAAGPSDQSPVTLQSVPPKDFFVALRSSQDPEMAMHATVLEEWHSAGWVPFQLDGKQTLERLEAEAGIVPHPIDGSLLRALVIGNGKFS